MTQQPEDLRTVEWSAELGTYVATSEKYPHLTAKHFDSWTAQQKLASLIRREERGT